MRAVRIHGYGGVEKLTLEEVPVPRPQAGDVVVRIFASSVNPIDWRIRSGSVQARLPVTLPKTLGCDFSGTVSEVGAGVTDFKVGDEVFAYSKAGTEGTYADYIRIPAAHIALRPQSLSLLDCAAVPLGAMTSYVALVEEAKLSDGQSVLIHAAAGGVGSMGVQIAKHVGAKVYATGSSKSADLIRSLGADVFINYNHEKFEDVARDMDVVLDGIGGEVQVRSLDCLKPNGFLAAIVNPPDTEVLKARGLRGKRCEARPDGALMAKFAKGVDDGALRPIIATVLPLEEIREAHRLSETGHMHGKILIQVG